MRRTHPDIVKRLFDVVTAILALVVTAPLWALASIILKVSSPGPVIYRTRRVGKGGHPFTLYKFRTMFAEAANSGPGVTVSGDERITRAGTLLRRTKIDELPQLFNVLVGDMSIVGPRPEDPRYVAHYTDEQRRVLSVRPGLTSPASIAYRYEEDALHGPDVEDVYVNEILPRKLELDLAYIEHRSVLVDLRVIVQTFSALFRRPVPT
jgi:lipopolysaccharide/colanic/teichoic acid biosynthesis glycosyltransferase